MGIDVPETKHFRALYVLVRDLVPEREELSRKKNAVDSCLRRVKRTEKRFDNLYAGIEKVLNDELTRTQILQRLERLLDIHSYR